MSPVKEDALIITAVILLEIAVLVAVFWFVPPLLEPFMR